MRLDFTVFDNDVYSVDIDDMRAVLDELAEDWRKMTEMSTLEKMKAALGYSKEGLLKYFNNDPVDYQKEQGSAIWDPGFPDPGFFANESQIPDFHNQIPVPIPGVPGILGFISDPWAGLSKNYSKPGRKLSRAHSA